jgi:hypothetical protein
MGILGDAIAAYAQVGSGQVSPQAAVDGMGLTPDENKMMVNLLEMQRLSLRDSGTLSSDLNSAQSRERMSLLDAQVTFHNNLQGHLESIQGLNADNWNQAQDRVVELQKSINQRDAELAKIPNNINQSAIQNMRRSTAGINGQWAAITGFLGTDGQGLTDGQLYATLERWRASENQDFLPENWQTKPWPEIEEHLTQQNVDASLRSRIRNAVDRAQGTHTQLEIARQSVQDTQTALDAIDTDPSAFDPTSTQAQINDLQANINNMLLQGDPTTGLNAQSAIQEQGLMQQSIDLLAEQVAYRDRLAAASPEQQSSLNRGLGALVTKPQFQQWAKDNGYRVGVEVGGQYVPGRQDQLAVLAFRQEFLRGMHEYGLSGGRTGEILEIPVPGQEQKYSVDGEMLTRSEIEERYPNGNVTVTDSGQIRVGLPEVFGDEDPAETTASSDPGLPTTMPDRVRLFDAAPLETIQVERARANAARILDDPNKIEVFIDGEIQIIDPDVVIRTVETLDDEAPEQISRRGIISRIKGLLENQGLLSQDTQLDETDTALVAEAAPAEVAPPAEVASTEPARAIRQNGNIVLYQRANGDYVTRTGTVIPQQDPDGGTNPQWEQMTATDSISQAEWEEVPREQFEMPGVPSNIPPLSRSPTPTRTAMHEGNLVSQLQNGDYVLPNGTTLSLRLEDGKTPNPLWVQFHTMATELAWEGEDPFSAQGIDFPFSDQEMATMTTVLDTDLPEPGEPDGLPGDTELQPASREERTQWTAAWGDGEVVYTQNEAGDITYTDPDTGNTETVTAESNPGAHSEILNQKDLIRQRRAEYVDSQRSIETDPKTSISEEYRPSPLEVPTVEPEPLEIEEPVSTPRPEVPNLTPLRDIPKPLEVPSVEPEPLEMATPTTERAPTRAKTPATPKADDRQPQRRLMGMFNRETPLFQNLRNRRDKKNGK